MDKQVIINILKTINYPNYSRDIVSFGIVDDILISDNNILLSLKLSAEEEIIQKIKNNIISTLRNNFKDIEVEIKIQNIESPKLNVSSPERYRFPKMMMILLHSKKKQSEKY